MKSAPCADLYCTSCGRNKRRDGGRYLLTSRSNGLRHRWICADCAARRQSGKPK